MNSPEFGLFLIDNSNFIGEPKFTIQPDIPTNGLDAITDPTKHPDYLRMLDRMSQIGGKLLSSFQSQWTGEDIRLEKFREDLRAGSIASSNLEVIFEATHIASSLQARDDLLPLTEITYVLPDGSICDYEAGDQEPGELVYRVHQVRSSEGVSIIKPSTHGLDTTDAEIVQRLAQHADSMVNVAVMQPGGSMGMPRKRLVDVNKDPGERYYYEQRPLFSLFNNVVNPDQPYKTPFGARVMEYQEPYLEIHVGNKELEHFMNAAVHLEPAIG